MSRKAFLWIVLKVWTAAWLGIFGRYYTALAKQKMGLTIAFNAVRIISAPAPQVNLFNKSLNSSIRPRATVLTCLIYALKFNFSSINTPNILICGIGWINWFLYYIKVFGLVRWLGFLKWINWNFFGSKTEACWSVHCMQILIAYIGAIRISYPILYIRMVVSSIHTKLVPQRPSSSTKAALKTINNGGEIGEPWGIPISTFFISS